MTVLGPVLARGRTSDVYMVGADSVVKVPRPGVPSDWAGIEAGIADAVHRAGLPTPEVRDIISVDSRQSIVFERIDGPSMWEVLLGDRVALSALVGQMVEIQRGIHRVEAPAGLDPLRSRISSKIRNATCLSEAERQAALGLVSTLPTGPSLCHGDLHPGNILMGRSGPVVIDWFDAAAGDGAADLVRTSLLLRPPSGGATPQHLPGASASLLSQLHRCYLGQVLIDICGPPDELLRWERVLAAGRLSENTGSDHRELLALWRSNDDTWPPKTQLAGALSSLGMI